MNRLFGFFRQKLIQAKQQNIQELDNIVNALGDTEPYQSQQALSHLQKIKENYMTWSILIANEASTGLFYSQVHNRNVCLKKIHSNKQSFSQKQKHQIISEQMRKTHEQLIQIADLNKNWIKQTTSKLDSLIQKFQPLESSVVQGSSQTQISINSTIKRKKSQKQKVQQKEQAQSSQQAKKQKYNSEQIKQKSQKLKLISDQIIL